ncbi:MAG: HAMP domain-containing sensor histidine kinase [Kofleriaceae bacterium]
MIFPIAPAPTAIGEELRARIRRGIDLAVLLGAALSTTTQLVDLESATAWSLLPILTTFLLGLCGFVGLIGRARWTPTAYVALIIVSNVVFMATYGPWFGLGAIYVLTIALAFVFMPRRWWASVAIVLVTTPVALGALFETGLLGDSPVMVFGDPKRVRLAVCAAITAIIGIAIVVSYVLRQLVNARREIEDANASEHEQQLQRARVEADIAHARRTDLIADLAAEVGTDIGAALAIIQTRAQALALELRGTVSVECLSDITESAATAAATVRSLTAFAPGVAELADARGNAADAVRALPKLMRRTLPAHVTLDIHADDDLWVPLLHDRPRAICSNLVLNARDAIVDRGTITVEVVRHGMHVVIEVSDDGTGMGPQVQAQLFQPFFTTKPIGRGTGLGLATTRILVERAGGSIGLDSELGRGTRFTIRLPLLAA